MLRWWSGNNTELGLREQEKHFALLNEVRASISRELKAAEQSREIIAREEFLEVINKFLIPYSLQFMLVTTNWDNVIGIALNTYLSKNFDGIVYPLHIHGSAKNPNTLYLPTEMTKEPYRLHEEEQQIGGLHGSIFRGMEEAHRAIVYGLSISPLDAELCQTLACGWSNSILKEIIIVDPNHEEIAHRINLLLDIKRGIQVKGFFPDKLDIEHDYTTRRNNQTQ